MSKLPDDEVIAALTAIPGIGPWTAQGALILALGREDVVLPGDLALRKAIQRAYELDHLPSQAEVLAIAEKWRPYRSVATSYLFSAAASTGPDRTGERTKTIVWRDLSDFGFAGNVTVDGSVQARGAPTFFAARRRRPLTIQSRSRARSARSSRSMKWGAIKSESGNGPVDLDQPPWRDLPSTVPLRSKETGPSSLTATTVARGSSWL